MNTKTVLIAGPALIALAMLGLLMMLMVGSTASQASGDLPSASARSDIPADYLEHYMRAGHEYKTDWWVLAGIGKVETNHGRSTLPGVASGVNAYGCCAGPMQFAVSAAAGCRVCVGDTWGAYGVDGNGDGIKSVYDPADAIPAAANYTSANGAPRDWKRALWRYNQSDAYYHEVMEWADRYRQPATLTPIDGVTAEYIASHPNISFHHPCQRSDVLSGQIDQRVLSLLAIVAQAHRIGVSSMRCDHSPFTSSGRPSNHGAGRAFDISDVDGQACTGSRDGNCGRLAIQIAHIQGSLRPTELIYCFDPDGAAEDAFAAADHCDHIHVGHRA